MRLNAAELWRAVRTPDGAATVHVVHDGDRLVARAWGPGAARVLDGLPTLVGADDDPDALRTDHPVVHDLERRLRGLRIGRSGRVMEALVPAILEQKVTTVEAHGAYRHMCFAWGEPAPGPMKLRLPPDPDLLAAKPYYEYHRFNVPRTKAEVIRLVCSRASKLEEATAMSPADAEKRLRYFTGVGAWTAAEVSARALGDPDVVSVGDFHLPHHVSWALAGEPRSDDDRMLELLEEFRGQRQRLIRLIEAGTSRPARRAPRARVRAIASI
jgi:3-methyladenine DNA glycosylase/8-oxoguanine DNA glycosylase